MSCPVLASSRTAAHKAYACVCIRYRRYLRYYTYGTTDRYTILYAITSFPTKRLEVWKCHRSVSRNIPSERPSKAQQNGFLRDFFDLCCAIKLRNRPAKISGNAAATTLTSALTQRLRFPEAKKVTPVVPIGPSASAGRRGGRHAPSSRVGATGPHRGSALEREDWRAVWHGTNLVRGTNPVQDRPQGRQYCVLL